MKLPKAKRINAEKYITGLSVFKKQVIKVKLSANESALGPSPKAIKEYNKVSKNFKRYPDTNGDSLRKILANKFKLNPERIILGSGSDQILELACKAFINKGDEVVVSKNSFVVYRIYSKINGAKIKYVKENNFTVSAKDILSCVSKKTKIVFLANPNNPTGTYLKSREVIFLRKKLASNILLVIDDAYFEYVKKNDYCSGLKLFSNSKNVIVTRTFSKIYGLAGLRVGWGYSSKYIIQSLNKLKPPFNVNSPALKAASAAIYDTKWLKKEIKHVSKWRNIMFEKFTNMQVETNKGEANFLLINFDRVRINSIKVFRELAKSGILVRKLDSYKIKNSLRISIGKENENKRLLLKLEKLINA